MKTNIEQEIVSKSLTAPTITLAYIKSIIKSVDFFTAANGVSVNCVSYHKSLNLLTFCVLTLRNGFTVTGESACASPEKYNKEIGEEIAYQNAVNKIWMLEGYLLKQELHDEANKKEEIAKVAHAVNKAYCEALGDNSQPTWKNAPQWQRESARMGVDLHTMGDFGPEASHISWMQQKLNDGWVYGSVKNADLKQHHCLMPFDQLPVEQQAKDFLFRAVVHAMR